MTPGDILKAADLVRRKHQLESTRVSINSRRCRLIIDAVPADGEDETFGAMAGCATIAPTQDLIVAAIAAIDDHIGQIQAELRALGVIVPDGSE